MMRQRFLVHLLVAFALCSTLAHASMGLTELPGLKGDGPVTVFYASDSPAAPVVRGPFNPSLALNGRAIAGNRRLIILSHGSGGAPWVHTDLAQALVDVGFVVALPEHRGDNYKDSSAPGPDSWKQRPAEVSRAIDAVARDARFAPLLDLNKVGVVGQSAGGHTALSLAGGRWSSARFLRHCEAHIAEDFNACVGTFTLLNGGLFDGMKKSVAVGVLRQRFDDETLVEHHDPRIAAAVAGVPAAADFDPASLARPRIPLGLVTAGRDRWLTPRWHSDAVLRACTPCVRIAHLPDGGHSILLSPLPPSAVLGEVERQLLADPPGFSRSQLPEVDRKIASFFRQHLLP
jgi:predicted dienelactone hydrolase